MNKSIAYTNTASLVTITFGHVNGVLVSASGKLSYVSPRQAEEFIEALKEAGYRAV